MQINNIRLLVGLTFLALVGCTPSPQDDVLYGAGFIKVNQTLWSEKYTKPYPFSVAGGEISCGSHPKFGREVYFEPEGFTNESYIGTPLNQAARNSLEQDNMASNVPYSIRAGADLSEAIKIGLQVCADYQDRLTSNLYSTQ